MKIPLSMKRMALVALLVWISTGCYVPIHKSSPESREHFPASRSDFTPGETTRADVLLKMGEPDEVVSTAW